MSVNDFSRNPSDVLTPREHRELRLRIEEQVCKTLHYPDGATTAQKVKLFRDAVESKIGEALNQRKFNADVEAKRKELAAKAYAESVERAARA